MTDTVTTIDAKPMRLGRPPGPARTPLARWLRTRGVSAMDLARALAPIGAELGIATPTGEKLREVSIGRHRATPEIIYLLELATDGELTLVDWVTRSAPTTNS